MTGAQWDPTAEELHELLTGTLGQMARHTGRRPSTSATPEQIDFVAECTAPLIHGIQRFQVALTTGVAEGAHWKSLAQVLEHAVEQVYAHAPPEAFSELPPMVDGSVVVGDLGAGTAAADGLPKGGMEGAPPAATPPEASAAAALGHPGHEPPEQHGS